MYQTDLYLGSMNAMNKHNLHRATSKHLCFQKINYHAFIFSTVFYLHLNTVWLKWVNLTTVESHIKQYTVRNYMQFK